jgi:hypothetical protein
MAEATIKNQAAVFRTSARFLARTLMMIGTIGTTLLALNTRAVADPAPLCTATSCTVTFATAGLGQTWTVPNGAASGTITLYGAAGGQGFDVIALGLGQGGGDGATVRGTLSLSAGTTVIVDVGGGRQCRFEQ